MNKDSKIFIAGPNGLVGSALIHHLTKKGYTNLLTPTHTELELLDTQSVANYFKKNKYLLGSELHVQYSYNPNPKLVYNT